MLAFIGRESTRLSLPPSVFARVALHWLKRKMLGGDEYDWKLYNDRYRAEVEHGRRFYTDDIGTVPFTVANGKLFLVSDALPMHPVQRCMLEAIINLHPKSVSEIGCGGGKFLAALREIMGPDVALGGYDISDQQLAFFRDLYPKAASTTRLEIKDITKTGIEDECQPEVLFAATVLMHIQRPDAYLAALKNILDSAKKAVVIIDNYTKHDYFGDLTREAKDRGLTDALWLYDTGNAKAIVFSLRGALSAPFYRLESAPQLAG